ncbi:MAG: lactate racemase domain-containing protein [Planctomycetia bacterium]|nr:lactate racemase domain-containing protein [Planctomycetia bacterium]
MKVQLSYGKDSEIEWDIPSENILYFHGVYLDDAKTGDAKTGNAIADDEIKARICAALDAPQGYPPLRECLIQGDSVVLPVAPGLPMRDAILEAILEYLWALDEPHRPGRVAILLSAHDSPNAPFFSLELEKILPEEWMRERTTFIVHDPEKKEHLALLGLNEANESLVVSRELFEADFVLPIGFYLPRGAKGYWGVHTSIYPLFSDLETRNRFNLEEERDELEAEAAEVTRQLGVALFFQASLAPRKKGAGRFQNLAAGAFHEMDAAGYAEYSELWGARPAARLEAGCAIATVSHGGDDPDERWRNIFRAVKNAANFVSDGGLIVVLADFQPPIPPSLEIYRQIRELNPSLKAIRKRNLPDAPYVMDFIRILNEYRVAFFPSFDGDFLEEIDVMPLQNLAELSRVVENRECVILPDAHQIIVR